MSSNAVHSAVVKASNKSKRKGKWASKPEISAKIVGKQPDNLGTELAKLVKADKIEKKKNQPLWRPQSGMLGGLMGASMAAGVRTGVESGIRGGIQSSVTHLLM
jgi:hypothetical protein